MGEQVGEYRARLALAAGFNATGYKLANDGVDTRSLQDYLGHASIASTVRYTKLSPRRFRNFWNATPDALETAREQIGIAFTQPGSKSKKGKVRPRLFLALTKIFGRFLPAQYNQS